MKNQWKRTHSSKEITPEMDNQEVIVMGVAYFPCGSLHNFGIRARAK